MKKKEPGTKKVLLFCDLMSSSYCEAFAVLPSQRVQAAIIGVREERWSERKVVDDIFIFLERQNKQKGGAGYSRKLQAQRRKGVLCRDGQKVPRE